MNLTWRAQAYLWIVVLAAGGLLAGWWAAWRGPLVTGPVDLALIALLCALAVVTIHFPLRLASNHKTNLVFAIYVAQVLLFSAPAAVAMTALGQVIGGLTLWRRRDPVTGKRLRGLPGVCFNTGQHVLAVGASAAVYGALLPHGATPVLDSTANLWAVPAAAVVLFLANTAAVALMVGLHRGVNPLRVWKDGRRADALHSLGLFPVGVATAYLAVHYPWAPLAMALPAAMLHLSLENTLRLVRQAEELAKREAEAAALRDLDRMKDELLSTISHELRTPLTVIYGYASRLQMSAKTIPPATVEESAGHILASSAQLSRLVTDLVDFGKAARGELEIQIECFDLPVLLGDVVSNYEERFTSGLRVDVPAHLDVMGDEIRVAQVFSNLLDNALKYAPNGPVEVHVRRGQDVVRVEVQDHGPGIPVHEQGRIWEKFFRGAQVSGLNLASGSGIGLAVVKALVEAQGGHVGVKSVAGEGACFWFELPTVPGSTPAATAAVAPAAQIPAAVPAPTPASSRVERRARAPRPVPSRRVATA